MPYILMRKKSALEPFIFDIDHLFFSSNIQLHIQKIIINEFKYFNISFSRIYTILGGIIHLFKIIYSKKAEKFLRKQDSITRKRLILAIGKLPLEGDIKKLQGVDGYRLRVGDFRILFDVNGVIIDIIEIGNRGQIYKGV